MKHRYHPTDIRNQYRFQEATDRLRRATSLSLLTLYALACLALAIYIERHGTLPF